MIIDAHVHIGRNMKTFREGENANHPLKVCRDLIESAEINGIEKLCVSSLGEKGYTAHPEPEEFIKANDYVLDAMKEFSENILGFCYVNPEYPEESVAEMERCIDAGMVGIKLWIACKASSPDVEPVLEKSIELKVPVLQHAWYKTTGNLPNESTPADVAKMARKFPQATIIMAHLIGGGYRGILDIVPYPNVLVDTSGSEPETAVVEFAVDKLKAERIVFGSDAPGRSFGVQLGKVLGANITQEQRTRILSSNMERILSHD